MCVTGLAPTNLSQLTTFQQFLLFAQTLMGSMVCRTFVFTELTIRSSSRWS
jgi:hypothetical protein